jgi:hypothetical protein
MAELTTIDAFDLCSRVLDRSQGDVAPLLKLTGGQETDWLEFKASCEPPVEGLSPSETVDEYRWHVARAMVALANTHGGCLLIGVDDDGKPVGLGPSDPSGQIGKDGMDSFLRHLDAAVLRRRDWKCGKKRLVKFDEPLPENLIEYRQTSLGGIPIVAVLVRPLAAGASCLYCSETVEDKQRHFLLIRQAGQLGQVREITRPKEMVNWEKERKPVNRHLAGLWKRFEMPGNRRSTRRRWLVFSTAALAILSVGIFALVQQNIPFAKIHVQKAELTFTGSKKHLGLALSQLPTFLKNERIFFSIAPPGVMKSIERSITVGSLEICVSGDPSSIKGMADQDLQDEIREKLVEQGIQIP